MHKDYEPIESKSIFPVESSPIVDKPDPLVSPFAFLLNRLCSYLRRLIVFGNDAYRSIVDTHNRVHVFPTRSMLIRVQLANSFLGMQRFFTLGVRILSSFHRSLPWFFRSWIFHRSLIFAQLLLVYMCFGVLLQMILELLL